MSIGPDGTQLGAEGSLDQAVPGAGGSDAGTGEQTYNIDGETYTAEQLQEALEARNDRAAWEASFKQRDQRYAKARGAIEAGFGKKLTEFNDGDLRDLQAFGLINTKLRSEPAFAKAWEESLTEAYKRAGATPAQAEAAAAQKVADVKAGQPMQLPKEVQDRLGRIDHVESMIVEQGLQQFQGVLEGDVKSAIERYAGGIENFHPMVRMIVLQGLSGYSDVEILEKYQAGELQTELQTLAKEATKQVRGYLGQKAGVAGADLASRKAGAPSAPFKGGTAEKVELLQPKPGAGMRGMTDRLLKDMGVRGA